MSGFRGWWSRIGCGRDGAASLRADILALLDVVRGCRRTGRLRITEKAREEAALHGWEDEDVYLFLDDLSAEDFRRREDPRYGAFTAIWVFTPEIVEPEGRLEDEP